MLVLDIDFCLPTPSNVVNVGRRAPPGRNEGVSMRSDRGPLNSDSNCSAVPVCRVGSSVASVPDELEDFLRHLINGGLPPKRPVRQLDPVARTWLPGACCAAARPPEIRRRRRELDFLFPGIKDLVSPTRKSGSGWGRKKRLSSLLQGAAMDAASSLEFDVLRDLELDPENSWFIEQPLKLVYDDAGRSRTCMPDVLVVRPEYVECLDVKYESQACLPEREATWKALGAAFQALGMGYSVITERHVRRQPRFRNVTDVFRRRHVPVGRERELAALAWLRAHGVATMEDFERGTGLSSNEVLALARRRSIAMDLDTAVLCAGTAVRVHTRAGLRPCGSGDHG